MLRDVWANEGSLRVINRKITLPLISSTTATKASYELLRLLGDAPLDVMTYAY